MNAIMDAVQSKYGQNVFIQKQFTGRLLSPAGAWVDVGTNGQADLGGFIARVGIPFIGKAVPFQIEVKTGLAVRSNAQVAWAALCERIGVPYLLADHDHAECAVKFLEEYRG